ncbi:MAG: thermosome subunit beta [Promethearchaeota archaeon]
MSLGGQPILILKEGTERTSGKSAVQSNIAAAKAIAEAVRTSLGPRGMDKMLVDSFGDVVITNDGATILKEIDVQHPAAKMMVEVAKTQDDEVGDGTTTSVILAGEFLKLAEKLLAQKVHPTIITEGFRKAAEKAIEILDEIGTRVPQNDRTTLIKAAKTAMNSKVVSESKERLAEIALDAVLSVAEQVDGTWQVDLDHVQIQKKEGESVDETAFIPGIILDKEVVNPGMPKRIEGAKIALVQCALEVEKTEFDMKLQITTPEQIEEFLQKEQSLLEEMVEKIAKSGANVVICQKGIDDMAQHFLAKRGILAVRRVKKSDLEKLSRATGGVVVTNLDDLDADKLGTAGLVEERKVMSDSWVFVEQCANPKAVVILIRGGTEMMVDEADRAIHDALCVVADVVKESAVVPGGGAVEIELAKRLREYAKTLSGREQLAVRAFADGLEVIPKTLAENAGLDQIEMLMQLRAAHGRGDANAGLDLEAAEVADMMAAEVLEPVAVKKQALKSASEAAQMILRIDDVIAGAKEEMPSGPPGGGGPGGMGGMGGMGM